MPQPPPASPGMPEDDIDTPALVLDLDVFERNLDTMGACTRKEGIRLRKGRVECLWPIAARGAMR